jgi:hypothetical protein
MKAVVFGLAASLLATSITWAQKQEQDPAPAQNQVLTYQVQPSEVEKAKTIVVRPKLEPQITYNGVVVDLARGENLFQRSKRTNVTARAAYDDLTVDIITRRPRGIVLFAINF